MLGANTFVLSFSKNKTDKELLRLTKDYLQKEARTLIEKMENLASKNDFQLSLTLETYESKVLYKSNMS